MYANYFGFRDIPFRQLSDHQHVFLSPGFLAAETELQEAVQNHARLILLTGHAGTGKTKLLSHLQVRLDETRPVLQGARLTSWELQQLGIPATLVVDSMAGSLMAAGEVDLTIVGADRIAANGDVANKIGTYSLAVLARYHDVPFYVAAPTSTIDPATASGSDIVVERRPASEVVEMGGVRFAPEGMEAQNWAFDVTPAELVTGYITEQGISTTVL